MPNTVNAAKRQEERRVRTIVGGRPYVESVVAEKCTLGPTEERGEFWMRGNELDPERDGPCRDINYDPTVLPAGITTSDDP